jgi:hypothetical protein
MTTPTTPTSQEAAMTATTTPADLFASLAREGGWQVTCRGDLLTIDRHFTPGDRDAYVAADGEGFSLLAIAPMTYPGTVWGTDGASVGGHAGLTGGYYHLNKSGVSKRFVAAVAKRLGVVNGKGF